MASPYSDAITAWHHWTAEHTAELLTDPAAHACAHLANTVIHEVVGEVIRLRDELARYQGRSVFHTTEDRMAEAVGQVPDARPGDILRATDTGREWIAEPPEFGGDPLRWEQR